MSHLPELTPLLGYCRQFRQRLARLLALLGAGRLICLAMVLFAALSLIDWAVHWNPWVRLATLIGFGAALAVVVWRTGQALRTAPWSDRQVLHQLGLRSPETSGQWLVWYELQTAGEQIEELQSATGAQMAEAATRRLAQTVVAPDWQRVFNTAPLRRWLWLAGVFALLLFVAATVLIPAHVRIGAQRLFVPFSTARWPHRTSIDVATPATGWTVPQLESFPIRAQVSGEIPAQITLAYRTKSNRTWVRERLTLREDQSVAYTFPEVREPVEFYLSGGDFQTDDFQIQIIQRPFLSSIKAHYEYPAYARLPDRTVPGGQLAGLEGTKVRLEMESSMPLTKAVLVLSTAPRAAAAAGPIPADPGSEPNSAPRQAVELQQLSPRQFRHELMLTSSGQYRVELYEPHGYREAKPEVYEIRVTPDEPPSVELLAPSQDLVETNQASIEVALQARDELGLAQVAVFYRLGPDEAPRRLSDLITGPIPQTGPESVARFTWELRQLELPESGTLEFFVQAQDNNPTGRGLRESQHRRMQLVKPSEFHLAAIEQAKLLEEEARIAWKNQLQAWDAAQRWLSLGGSSTPESETLWTELQDAQQRALQATRQIRVHLQTLTDKFQRNHMGADFMAGRLSVVAELLTRLQESEQAPITTSLNDARPQSSADAAPARLAQLRGTALAEAQPHQKMAVLILERMLRKLYDWRDLQSAAITTKLLDEQQQEVLQRTEQVAPLTIAKEIEDLPDQEQDRLLTLGKQQRAIFDTETGLEQQLIYMMYKAEKQVRKSILDPLRAAFNNLRTNRVNDHLKLSADLIANNQPSQIINSQKAALRALQVVQAGLVAAGQKVDEDPPLALSMTPTSAEQFDPDQIKPPEVAAQSPENASEAAVVEVPSTVELPTLPEGSDALSASIRLALELEDSVLARMRYLHENRGPREMPRFVQLKLLRLRERQDEALEAVLRARQLNAQPPAAGEPEQAATAPPQAAAETTPPTGLRSAPQVESLLNLVQAELLEAHQLAAAAEVDASAQQVQADAIATLHGILQHIAFVRAIDDATAENRRLQGVDGFNRPYLLRQRDLDVVMDLVGRLHYARQRQAHAARLVQRWVEHPPIGPTGLKLLSAARQQAVDSQRLVAQMLTDLAPQRDSLSAEVAARVQAAGWDQLAKLPATEWTNQIASGQNDAALAPQLPAAVEQLDGVLIGLTNLFEERVRPPEVATSQADQPAKMTLEDYQRLTSPEELAKRLRAESSLPPEIRDAMARSLERELPPRYRQLLTAYFASFVGPPTSSDQAAPATPAPPASGNAPEVKP